VPEGPALVLPCPPGLRAGFRWPEIWAMGGAALRAVLFALPEVQRWLTHEPNKAQQATFAGLVAAAKAEVRAACRDLPCCGRLLLLLEEVERAQLGPQAGRRQR
jgi:hypothetical protein